MRDRPRRARGVSLRCVLCAALALALAAAALLVEAGAARADDEADKRKQRQEEQRKQRQEEQRRKRLEKERGPTADAILARADKDGDGRISKDEFMREAYERYGGRGAARKAKGADKDMDGELSFEEFCQLPPANDRWKKQDRDGSGFLERPELEAMALELSREQRRRLPEFLRRYDDDGDGRIARGEFSGPDPVFARLDRNGDGVVDERDEPEGAPPATPPPPSSPVAHPKPDPRPAAGPASGAPPSGAPPERSEGGGMLREGR